MIEKIWKEIPLNRKRVGQLAVEFDLPEPLAAILLTRGVESKSQLEKFFAPSLAELPSPFLMKGMDEAVAVVLQALDRQQPVLVYGDYDVDGITGVALLYLFLEKIGFSKIYTCQPDRLLDGYGVHLKTIRRTLSHNFLEQQTPLVITVDCGISSRREIEELRALGCQVIVTDHHQPSSGMPDTEAVLNPWQNGCAFPDKNLAGVGVAFYLAMGIRRKLYEQRGSEAGRELPNLKAYLDLVAVGTVADMVPITGVNRIMIIAGIEVLGTAVRPGLSELGRVSGLTGTVATCEDIGFRLGPRINAAGRMGDAGRALALLITEDSSLAREHAQELNRANESRKAILEEMCLEAYRQGEVAVKAGQKGLIISGVGWHPGVIGIGAARIMEKFRRPTLLFSIENGIAKGSGRSLPGIDLHRILNEKNELFSAFGGHRAAVGITMAVENLPELEMHFQKRVSEAVTEEMFAPVIEIFWHEMGGAIFSPKFLQMYERIGPFGIGNPEPIFSARGMIGNIRKVGVNHLKFTAHFNEAILDGIAFGLSEVRDAFSGGQPVDVAFRFRRNTYRDKTTWQVEALDFKQVPS